MLSNVPHAGFPLVKRPMLVVSDHVTVDNACLQLPVDALRRQDELSALIPAMNAVAVPTAVLLPGRLPGNSEPIGNVWPPNAQAGRVIDQHCEFRLCAVPSKLARSIRSSSCGADSRARRCAAGVSSAVAWRRSGCSGFTRGPGMRFDLLTHPACGSGVTAWFIGGDTRCCGDRCRRPRRGSGRAPRYK